MADRLRQMVSTAMLTVSAAALAGPSAAIVGHGAPLKVMVGGCGTCTFI
ncbi:MAG: hypothetical protein LC804_11400 [Acidobacteria bacterium]|nr:hypothetical protein [Acidobacteriota bacterium]